MKETSYYAMRITMCKESDDHKGVRVNAWPQVCRAENYSDCWELAMDMSRRGEGRLYAILCVGPDCVVRSEGFVGSLGIGQLLLLGHGEEIVRLVERACLSPVQRDDPRARLEKGAK